MDELEAEIAAALGDWCCDYLFLDRAAMTTLI
jgi:hypothetical protein